MFLIMIPAFLVYLCSRAVGYLKYATIAQGYKYMNTNEIIASLLKSPIETGRIRKHVYKCACVECMSVYRI